MPHKRLFIIQWIVKERNQTLGYVKKHDQKIVEHTQHRRRNQERYTAPMQIYDCKDVWISNIRQ